MGGCFSSSLCCLCCLGELEEYKVHKDARATNSPSSFPCAATGLYTPLPSVSNTDLIRHDAEYLLKAMKGCGTVDSDLCRMLGHRSLPQIYKIKKVFDEEFGGSGGSLEDWIKGDTSGDFEKILLMAIQNRAERDAVLIQDAIAGLGTNDDELIELITTRSNKHLQEIAAAYKARFGKTAISDIKEDTSFNYRNTLVALFERAEYLARQLHDAIAGAGTDDIRLIRILCSAPRSNRLLRQFSSEFEDNFNTGWKEDIEFEISMPDLQDIKDAYQRLFHKSLVQDVASDTSGNYRRTLLTLLQPPEETTADALHLAVEGKGTNDELLIEIMTCRSNRELQDAAQVYQTKYGRSMRDAIASDTSGDYEKTLLSLLKPRWVNVAWHLNDSMEGVGTDDTRLMSLVVGKSRRELRRISAAYFKEYGKTLESAIDSETSFWYKRFLIFLIRQSEEDWVWVPEHQLFRLRDV